MCHEVVYTTQPAKLNPAQLATLRQAYDILIFTNMNSLKRATALGISKKGELWVLSKSMLHFAENLGWSGKLI